jgi:hypothetical protein
MRTAEEGGATVEGELRPLDADFADAEFHGGVVAMSSSG